MMVFDTWNPKALIDSSWKKTWLILSTAVNTRLNFLDTTSHAKSSSSSSPSHQLQGKMPAIVSFQSTTPTTSITWTTTRFAWKLRAVPVYTWLRLLIHILTILLFFQFRAWLHGPAYMYKWTIMENHVALMPTFFPDRVLSYAQHHFWYLWKFVYPRHLCFDYGYQCVPVITSVGDWRNVLPLVAYGVVAGAVVHAVYRLRLTLLFGWALWLSSLVPALNILIPVGNLLAERLMFVPSIGFCLVLAEYLTVDGAWLWYQAENYLWAILDAFEIFASDFQLRWDDAMQRFYASHYDEVVVETSAERQRLKSTTRVNPMQERKTQEQQEHETAVIPERHEQDGSVFDAAASSTAVESPTSQQSQSKSSKSKGKRRSSSSSSSSSSRSSQSFAQIMKKWQVFSDISALLVGSSSLLSSLSVFAFLWTGEYWCQAVTAMHQTVADQVDTNRRLHPSRILFQGKFVLFLVGWPIIALGMMRIISRNADWHSELSIYSSALNVCPQSVKALGNTAVLMSSHAEFNEISARYVDASMALYQNSTIGLVNQGLAQHRLGHSLSAVMAFERALVATHPTPPPNKAEGYLSVVLYKWAASLPAGVSFSGLVEDDVRKAMMRQAHVWSLRGINRGFQSPLMFYNAASMAVEVEEYPAAIALYELAIRSQQTLHERYLRSGKTLPQEDTISLRYALNMYALALTLVQRYDDALVAYQESIRLFQSEEGGGHNPFSSIINLAQLLNHHMLKSAEARDVLHQYVWQYHCPAQWTLSPEEAPTSLAEILQNETLTMGILRPWFASISASSSSSSPPWLPPVDLAPAEWPVDFGRPVDWLLLSLTSVSPSSVAKEHGLPVVPAILWHNLGHVVKQLGHHAVAMAYFAHGLDTYVYQQELRQRLQPSGVTNHADDNIEEGLLVPKNLPAVLLDCWQAQRQRLTEASTTTSAVPAAWEALLTLPMF